MPEKLHMRHVLNLNEQKRFDGHLFYVSHTNANVNMNAHVDVLH